MKTYKFLILVQDASWVAEELDRAGRTVEADRIVPCEDPYMKVVECDSEDVDANEEVVKFKVKGVWDKSNTLDYNQERDDEAYFLRDTQGRLYSYTQIYSKDRVIELFE